MPTGGGKTRIALRVALRWLEAEDRDDTVVLWVTHRRRLHLQARRALQQLLRDSQGAPDNAASLFASRIQFWMIGDLEAALLAAGDRLALVIVDEAHHAAAPSYEPLFGLAAAPGLFLTATPNRADTLPIGIDEIAYTITYRELFRRNCLAEPVFEPPLDLRGLDWSEPGGLRDLADYLLDRADADFGKVLVAVSTRERAENLYEAVAALLDERPGSPLSSADVGFVHAERNSGEVSTADFLDEFSARPTGVLVATSQLIGEGYDDPSIDAVVVTYPSGSISHLMQVAGRALRTAPGKTVAHIVQVHESPLEYHFDQRWLYQDISDQLHPELIDRTYGSAPDLSEQIRTFLAEHRVPAPMAARIERQLQDLEAGSPVQLMLTGVPYFGPPDSFEAKAEWGAILVTPGERDRFTTIFNDVSYRTDDIKEHGLYLARHLSPDSRGGSLWKSYVDLVTAMEYARREITGAAYAGADSRPYQQGRSTTWLRYASFRFEPVLPAELDQFLHDAFNRDAVIAEFLQQPGQWAAVAKIELPLTGTMAYLLTDGGRAVDRGPAPRTDRATPRRPRRRRVRGPHPVGDGPRQRPGTSRTAGRDRPTDAPGTVRRASTSPSRRLMPAEVKHDKADAGRAHDHGNGLRCAYQRAQHAHREGRRRDSPVVASAVPVQPGTGDGQDPNRLPRARYSSPDGEDYFPRAPVIRVPFRRVYSSTGRSR